MIRWIKRSPDNEYVMIELLLHAFLALESGPRSEQKFLASESLYRDESVSVGRIKFEDVFRGRFGGGVSSLFSSRGPEVGPKTNQLRGAGTYNRYG